MQIIEKGGERLVVLGGAMLHEEDYKQVLSRAQRTGRKFTEALADYVRDLRGHVERTAAPLVIVDRSGEVCGGHVLFSRQTWYDELKEMHRWNFEQLEDGVYGCRNDHHRSQACEYFKLNDRQVDIYREYLSESAVVARG